MNEKKGKVISMNTGKHRNPIKRKSGAQIHQEIESVDIRIRAHAYCQPNFCSFYGGTHMNCDGTRREGTEVPDQTVWASHHSLGPEWRHVTKGTPLASRTK